MSGLTVDKKTYYLAVIIDLLSILLWWKTEDGQNGKNRPESISEKFVYYGPEEKKESEYSAFSSVEEYEAARAEFFTRR